MRGLIFDTALRFDARAAEPPVHEGDTLIRVVQAGICATDLEICSGYMNFNGVLGHEFVGVVEQSSDATLVGRRVVAEINCVCGTCDLCTTGLGTHCRRRTVVGILNHGGAFADYVRVPAINCHVVPDSIDDDHAVFVEPLAAAYQVLRQVAVDEKTFVTVLGDGRLGLLCAQVLRNAGAPVRLLGRHAEKMTLCDKWQIKARSTRDVAPRHDQDVVVDCTGSADGFELAMQLVRPRGTIVLKSTVAQGKPMNLAPIVIDEINVVGSRCGPFDDALRGLERREVDVLSLIQRRFKIEEGVDAMAIAGRKGVLKVMLMMGKQG
jgi:threonine dehydrogenase-like Zn-dependent dehydrogenase